MSTRNEATTYSAPFFMCGVRNRKNTAGFGGFTPFSLLVPTSSEATRDTHVASSTLVPRSFAGFTKPRCKKRAVQKGSSYYDIEKRGGYIEAATARPAVSLCVCDA